MSHIPFTHGFRLDDGWRLRLTDAGACATADEACDVAHASPWIAARVPGTAAQALREAGQWTLTDPAPLHDKDIWYRGAINGHGRRLLRFDGLATIAEIWLDDARIGVSETMFAPLQLTVELDGAHRLCIVFRALDAHLAQLKLPRARWRTQLIDHAALRGVRTTLLGHMPGWCPPVDAVGPWAPITLIDPAHDMFDLDLRPRLHGDDGVLDIFLRSDRDLHGAQVSCGGASARLTREEDRWRARMTIPAVARWFPNGLGAAALHDVTLADGARDVPLGRVGFRDVAIDRGADGKRFGLIVNGAACFARGVCWTPADIVALTSDEEACRRELTLLREAGVNLIRIAGTMTYESDAFYAMADACGLMIWQELQLANFDYPFADAAFAAQLRAEVDALLARLHRHPCVVALCGGSEMAQQAQMMGAPPALANLSALERMLDDAVSARDAAVATIINSPSGGAPCFVVNEGVAHYYGVGAYQRPLDDARRADVTFAAECLAFAHAPDAATLDANLPVAPVHHPLWKARTPRDRGASWDFEDVREFYMALLYGVDCDRLRREDPQRYLAVARATTAEVIEATLGEWRRVGSRTRGALLYLWKDFLPGAGWGVIDATGRPKSAYFALKRACRPLQLVLIDEGVNGLHAHVINETFETRELALDVVCLRDGATPVVQGQRAVRAAPLGGVAVNVCDLFGAFFDTTYAYRFGPPAHDATVARLRDDTGAVIAQAFHFPLGRACAPADIGLSARLIEESGEFTLEISCARLARSVVIDDAGWIADDNGFHLAPGAPQRVRLRPLGDGAARPAGRVSALNSVATMSY